MTLRILAGTLAATAIGMGAAHAGSDDCCEAPPFPQVVYASPPAVFAVPPTRYVLDPSDAIRPVYVVNQGPYAAFGAVPLARPTYSQGGYAYLDAFPYDAPYIYSYGRGMRYGYRASRIGHGGAYRAAYDRPYGALPYTAYRYRLAPSARIIHIERD